MRMPDRDLCADLRNAPSDLGDAENVCTASNRQLRLYVAAWMLSDECPVESIALRRALDLYDGCGRALLDRPGRLTTAAIAAEVMMLAPVSAENDGR